MRETVEDKACRLLSTRSVAVLEVSADHAIAQVHGDHGTYHVEHDGRWRCSCPTPPGRACSHGLATARVVPR
jgi:hypothetical protein